MRKASQCLLLERRQVSRSERKDERNERKGKERLALTLEGG